MMLLMLYNICSHFYLQQFEARFLKGTQIAFDVYLHCCGFSRILREYALMIFLSHGESLKKGGQTIANQFGLLLSFCTYESF